MAAARTGQTGPSGKTRRALQDTSSKSGRHEDASATRATQQNLAAAAGG